MTVPFVNQNRIRLDRKRTSRTKTTSVNGTQIASRWYLLFAGSGHAPRGGLGDLVQTFVSEEMACTAFRERRLTDGSASSWAQLVVVDGEKGVQPLCWFGIGATPNRNPTLFAHPDGVASGRAEQQ